MRSLSLILLSIAGIFAAEAATRVQVIHNGSFDDGKTIDVYLDNTKVAESDDINYREATSFIDVTPNSILNVKVNHASSIDANDQNQYSFNTQTLSDNNDYVIVLSGVDQPSSFNKGLNSQDIDFDIYQVAADADTNSSGNYKFNLFHGVIDAPAIDLYTIQSGDTNRVAAGLTYGNSTEIQSLPEGEYELMVSASLAPKMPLLTYFISVNPTNINKTYTLFASGFAGGSQPVQNQAEYELGLFQADAEGTVSEFSKVSLIEYAYVQMVHNSPDPSTETIDIYVNDILLPSLDNVSFRTATTFLPLLANQNNEIKVTASDADSSDDNTIYTRVISSLSTGSHHIAMVNGVVDTGFNTGESSRDISMMIDLYETMNMTADTANVGVVVAHGGTDAPTIDVYTDITSSPFIDNLMYSESFGYAELAADDYMLSITPQDSKNLLYRYDAPLTNFDRESVFIFASGFISIEDEGNGDIDPSSEFGLFLVDSEGNVVKLQENIPMAFLQVIHNAPDVDLETVDIYLNDKLLRPLTGLDYRHATEFLPVRAGFTNTVKVMTPDTSNKFEYSITLPMLEENSFHLAVANGVSETDSYNSGATNRDLSFGLNLFETTNVSADTSKVSLFVVHGATDAPTIDIFLDDAIQPTLTDLTYGNAADSLLLDPKRYRLGVAPTETNDLIQTYVARLEDYEGKAMTLFASGFVTPEDENNSEGVGEDRDFGLYVAEADGNVFRLITLDEEPPAYVQVIHNSPDPRVETVDVYINNELLPELNDISFREATAFLPLEAFKSVKIDITDSDAGNSGDKNLYTITIPSLEADGYYIASATGVVRSGFQKPNPTRDISLMLNLYETKMSPMDETNVGLVVAHGATDAPDIDIYTDINGSPMFKNLDYGTSTSYTELAASFYEFVVTPTDTMNPVVGTYPANLRNLDNQSAFIFASGFTTPEDERPDPNANYDEFTLMMALKDGTVINLATDPQEDPIAYLQVIHNSGDPRVSTVDVYVNDQLLDQLNDISYREASAFLELPAGEEHLIEITAKDAANSDSTNLIYSFTTPVLPMNTYHVAMANGVIGTDFVSFDSQRGIGFEIDLYPTMSLPVDTNNVGLIVAHGATDAPDVDVYADIEANPLYSNITYGNATVYTELPAMDYELTVTATGTVENIIETYLAPLAGLENNSYVIFASGFVTTEDEDQGAIPSSSSFGLYLAMTDGTVIPLNIKPDDPIAYVQFIHNSPDTQLQTIDVYINGTKNNELDNISFRQATTFIPVPIAESTVSVNLATSSNSLELPLTAFPVSGLEANKYYTAMLTGVGSTSNYILPQGRSKSIKLDLFPTNREAQVDGDFDFKVFHGAPDLGIFDVEVYSDNPTVISGLDYLENTDWISQPANSNAYISFNNLDIINPMNNRVYGLPTETPSYSRGTIFVSGFANITIQPSEVTAKLAKPYLALPNGIVVPLAQTNVSVNQLSEIADIYPNPATDILNITLPSGLLGGIARVYSITGALMMEKTIERNLMTLTTSELPSSTYIIEYIVNGKRFSSAFIKK